MSATVVTGGAGFIGSAVVRRLLDESSDTVVTVDKLTYAGHLETIADAMASPRHVLVRADVADAAAMRAVFETHRPRAVLHLAAESHVDRSIDAPAAFVHTNVVGTFTLLQEARRYWASLGGAERDAFRFVHVSTDEVFGALGPTGAFDADTRYAPTSPYSASKAGADHLARAWHHTYGLPVIVTNTSNNYGPYQFPEKLIPLAIERGRTGKSIPVYGRGENVRDWLFVDDHARALLDVSARGRPGETYLIGARAERRNIDVVRAICALLDELAPDPRIPAREALIEFVADRPGHDLRYAIDPTTTEREIGWRPRMSFEAGLRHTVEWYLANVEWCETVRRAAPGGFDGERLGLAANVT